MEPIARSHRSPVLPLQFFIVSPAHAKTLGDDLDPIAGKVDENGEEGADVEGDVEGEAFGLPAQQPGSEVEVGSAADGQELGEAWTIASTIT